MRRVHKKRYQESVVGETHESYIGNLHGGQVKKRKKKRKNKCGKTRSRYLSVITIQGSSSGFAQFCD